MDLQTRTHEADAKITFTVLVTGVNSGLGFGICCRLIDAFLSSRPQSQSLHILFSTRDAKKSLDTLKRLDLHLQKTAKRASGRSTRIGQLLASRIRLEGVLVDLTRLSTVKELAEKLLSRNEHIDAVVWNAGIAGWNGINKLEAFKAFFSGFLQATTYPTFAVPIYGLIARPQSIETTSTRSTKLGEEPSLGQVFLSNVLGHYMLTHWLAPLLDSHSRIIWISSINAPSESFSLEDIQGLRAEMPYEGSKRLLDLMVLTSELPSTRPYVSHLLGTDQTAPRPKMYVTHPGVIQTAIAGLNWFDDILTFFALYLARWIGSPWHLVTAYKGAVSAVFAVLAPESQLADFEARDGKGKWGSACDVRGDERVARTEVEGWGFCGQVDVIPSGSVTTSRRPNYKVTSKEMREDFEEEGRRCWIEIEELRQEWEERVGNVSAPNNGR